MAVFLRRCRTHKDLASYHQILRSIWDEGGITRRHMYSNWTACPAPDRTDSMFGAVFLVFSDGEPVGFFDAELPYLNEAVIISYGLVAGARGKGIGRIALRRVLIRLSEFPLVEAHIHSANRASRALVESAGFRHTGYSDELLVFLLDREELAARQGFRASVSSRSDQSLETRIAHVP